MCQRTLTRCRSVAVGNEHAGPPYYIRQLFQDGEALGDVPLIERGCADAIIEHARRTCPEALGSNPISDGKMPRSTPRDITAMRKPVPQAAGEGRQLRRRRGELSAARETPAFPRSLGARDRHRGNIHALHVPNLLGDFLR